MTPRAAAKWLAFWIASVAVAPALMSFIVRRLLLGPDRAVEGSTQALALVPGLFGQYLRRAFLVRALAHCDRSATIGFGTIFSKAEARIGANVYVGPGCHIGMAHIERDALIAAGVHIPSGPLTHGVDDAAVPIREQPGEPRVVRIGAGAWIGSAAIVLADVGPGSVVGAGSVVTQEIPECVVAAGVPARVLRERRPASRP